MILVVPDGCVIKAVPALTPLLLLRMPVIRMTDASLHYVSCAADRLYQNGASPADLPAGLLDVQRARDASITYVRDVFPAMAYRWCPTPDILVAPDAFGQTLVDSYRADAEKYCPTVAMVEILNAIVTGSLIQCGNDPHQAILYETYRPNDRLAVPLPNAEAAARADRIRFAGSDEACFLLGSAGSFNYGHWLVDDLPRLRGLALHRAAGHSMPTILLASYGDRINTIRVRTIRRLLGPETDIAFIDPQISYHVARLLYISPVSYHPRHKSPVAMQYAVDALLPPSPIGGRAGGDRLFLQRGGNHGRSLLNSDAVGALLTQHGFRHIDPETMSFDAQASTLANASIVIGQMGAAMTNTMFCAPATTVLHLAPHGWVEPFYWDLAVVRGHQYRVLFGRSAMETGDPHLRDFTIALPELETALVAFGLLSPPRY